MGWSNQYKACSVERREMNNMVREKFLSTCISICLLVASLSLSVKAQGRSAQQAARREVVVTFDDLPVISVVRHDIATYREITTKLLKSITANKVPAIGFVNENKLYRNGELDQARVALLQMWLDAGLELGNHTFSHPDLHRTPLDKFQADVIQGEAITSRLLQKKGARLRYFRHPFLHTGLNLQTKTALEKFLFNRGYTIAPVTIDNSDWIFAAAYAKAAERQDQAAMKRVADAYIPYMQSMFEYFEKMSVELLGYEPPQVLLLHANALNADHFGGLARMMQQRGYVFITLEQALKDNAYRSPDSYTGTGGLSWLHRWGRTRGIVRRDEPDTPQFVMKLAGVTVE